MGFYSDRDIRKGEIITAEFLRKLQEMVRCFDNLDGGQNILVDKSRDKISFTFVEPRTRFLCIAHGDISPRSGTTAGDGQVERVLILPDGTLQAQGSPYLDVFNPSETEMSSGVGIATGLYCWAERTDDGVWIVSPLECP